MSPFAVIGWLATVVLGHFTMMLTGYNRVNSLGYPRRWIKRTVKVMFLFTIGLPAVVAWQYHHWFTAAMAGQAALDDLPYWLWAYGGICLLSMLVFGIPWLVYRPIFAVEWVRTRRQTEVVDVTTVVENKLPMTSRCRWLSRIPGNQIFQLAIDTIQLPVAGLPAPLDGFRIAHLSDIHLTGQVHPDFFRYVVERANQWEPDLMVMSGDIIDSRPCIAWLGDIFSQAETSEGCYYVLGNHDTKVGDDRLIRVAMDDAGWIDLGGLVVKRSLWGVNSLIIGNEYPWYGRPDLAAETAADPRSTDAPWFRLLVSHSPDQINWARKRNVTLMLAGHTHGGQGRLPLVGPVLSPSRYGSRYASGDFFKSPTTMHVTRGLSGTHLARINCRPQLSQLVLRSS